MPRYSWRTAVSKRRCGILFSMPEAAKLDELVYRGGGDRDVTPEELRLSAWQPWCRGAGGV